MKNINKLSFFIVLFFFVSFMGCQQSQPPTPNPCASVVCENGGTCNSGSCNCVNDFWGTSCEFTPQQKIYGWDGSGLGWAPCSGSPLNFYYTLEIGPISGEMNDNNAKVYIYNADGLMPLSCNLPIEATINGASLTANSQSLCGNQIINFTFETHDGFNATLNVEYLLIGDSVSIVTSQLYCREGG